MQFSPEVVDKARRLLSLSDNVQEDPEYRNIWWVQGTAWRYRVQSDYDQTSHRLSWITCTCPHGVNVGAGATRCYHAAAVLLLLRERHVAREHAPREGREKDLGWCTCGWPTLDDFRAHAGTWEPDFSQHLVEEQREESLRWP